MDKSDEKAKRKANRKDILQNNSTFVKKYV